MKYSFVECDKTMINSSKFDSIVSPIGVFHKDLTCSEIHVDGNLSVSNDIEVQNIILNGSLKGENTSVLNDVLNTITNKSCIYKQNDNIYFKYDKDTSPINLTHKEFVKVLLTNSITHIPTISKYIFVSNDTLYTQNTPPYEIHIRNNQINKQLYLDPPDGTSLNFTTNSKNPYMIVSSNGSRLVDPSRDNGFIDFIFMNKGVLNNIWYTESKLSAHYFPGLDIRYTGTIYDTMKIITVNNTQTSLVKICTTHDGNMVVCYDTNGSVYTYIYSDGIWKETNIPRLAPVAQINNIVLSKHGYYLCVHDSLDIKFYKRRSENNIFSWKLIHVHSPGGSYNIVDITNENISNNDIFYVQYDDNTLHKFKQSGDFFHVVDVKNNVHAHATYKYMTSILSNDGMIYIYKDIKLHQTIIHTHTSNAKMKMSKNSLLVYDTNGITIYMLNIEHNQYELFHSSTIDITMVDDLYMSDNVNFIYIVVNSELRVYHIIEINRKTEISLTKTFTNFTDPPKSITFSDKNNCTYVSSGNKIYLSGM